jgi:tripartite motif-containing protein 71
VFLATWGKNGTAAGEFSYPYGVAADAAGRVYIADTFRGRIQKFDSNGTFLSEWGSYGTTENQFSNPFGMVVNASGTIFVADTDNHRIQRSDSSGNFQLMWGWGVDAGSSGLETCSSGCWSGTTGSGDGQFANPYGVTVDASGNVFVADTVNHRIQKFDSNGTFLLMWGWGVDDGSSAFQTCSSGCKIGIQGGGIGQLNYPRGLASDASGNVFVADTGNSRIQVFSGSGSILGYVGTAGSGDGQLNSPWGVAVDSAGNIYVADAFNYRLQKFDSSGSFLSKWGSYGSAPKQFLFPGDVEVDASGNIYVVDADNHRVQKFGGPLLEVFVGDRPAPGAR